MICYVDNDAILKLTACVFFWEAITLLGIKPEDIRVLGTAKFVFQGKKVKKNYSEDVCRKAITVVENLTQIRLDPSNPFVSIQTDGLDIGELTLIGAAIKEPCFYLVTGDKRCLRALGESIGNDARKRLSGRVVCFEQLIVKLIVVNGFEFVKRGAVPARYCDTVLKVAFGSGDFTIEENSLLALEAYIAELKQDCPDLLFEF